jgi:hypothetical protein
MEQRAVFWIVLGLVAEKILQHGLTAIFFVVNIDGIGKPEVGNRIPLSDPVMAVLNCIMMGFFVWAFLDIWKSRRRGLHLVIVLSLFDIVAEFVFHGVGLITISVIVAIFLIGFSFILNRLLARVHVVGF